MNHAIELHDTEVVGITTVGDQVVVFLRAYVHQSAGHPARDPGTGWIQAAVLLFGGATTEGELPESPMYISRGSLTLAEMEPSGLVPIPLAHQGTATLYVDLLGNDGSYAEVTVSGSGAVLTLIGEPVYVEEFPW